MDRFYNRTEAGKVLSGELKEYAHRPDVTILALPRGGVPVASEIAKHLSLPLDVFIVRKLGVPGHEELAMGAIASGGTIVLNKGIINKLHINQSMIDKVTQAEQAELDRREIKYRGNSPFPELNNRTVILVDDGIATGATMRAAIQALRQKKPLSIIVAVPVAAFSSCAEFSELADRLICPLKPKNFNAVGLWYEHFDQTDDKEVTKLLNAAKQNPIHSG